MSECSVWACSKCLTCMYLFDSPHFPSEETEMKWLAQGPKAGKLQRKDLNPGSLDREHRVLIAPLTACPLSITPESVTHEHSLSSPPFSLVSGVPDKSSVCAKSRCFWSLVAFCLLCPAVYSPETEADSRTPWVDSSWNRELWSDFLLQRENEDLQDMGLEGAGRAVSSLCCPGIFQCAQLQVGDSSKWPHNQ